MNIDAWNNYRKLSNETPQINAKFTPHLWRIFTLFFHHTGEWLGVQGVYTTVGCEMTVFLEHKFIYSVLYWHIQNFE